MLTPKEIQQRIKENKEEGYYSILYVHDDLMQIYNVRLDDALSEYKRHCTELAEFASTAFLIKKAKVVLFNAFGEVWHSLNLVYKSKTYESHRTK